MYVLLDTNIVFKDYFFRFKSIKTLFSYLDTSGHNLLLPRIVLDELGALYKRHLEETNENIKKVRADISLLNIGKKPNYINVLSEIKKYKEYLNKTIKENKIIVLENNDDHYKNIISRSLRKTPPFSNKKGDSGFKDAIIWECFKEAVFLDKYKSICFVTKNKNDFSDPDDEKNLHPILKKELSGKKFFYFQSLEGFLEKYGVLLEDVTLQVILDAVTTGFSEKIKSLSEKQVEDFFSESKTYPIYSVAGDDLSLELKHHYVTKADGKNYYVVATGIVHGIATFYNPLEDDYFEDHVQTTFEAVIKIEKNSKKTNVESFEIETIVAP